MKQEEILGKFLSENNLTISSAESCTGGLLSSKLTDVSGSSAFVRLNLVTYSNEAKQKMLGVKDQTLKNFGAVSKECAFEMAKGLYKLTKSDICISTTGIAGPTGGTKEKPVGLMYSTIYTPTKHKTYTIQVNPELYRVQIKEAFAQKILENLLEFLQA